MRVPLVAAAGLLLALPALAGCIQAPVDPAALPADAAAGLLAAVPETVTKLEPVGRVEFGAGNDLAFHGDLAFVSTHNNGLHVIDVSDPANPVEVTVVGCNGKDVDVRKVGERVIVTISSQGVDGNEDLPAPRCEDGAPKGGIRLVDVTDPANPVVLKQVPLKYGSHTHTPYGDTGLVYNSAYNLASNPTASPKDHSRSEIVDVSNPDDPKVVGEFLFPASSTSIGCHDILAEPRFNRAVCAGITETMIWDTTDPLKPVVTDTLVNPLINIHHSAATARNGTLLMIGDEFGGAAAPACHPLDGAPTGAIWFYGIDGHSFGDLHGFFPPVPGEPGKVCTAHNFNAVDGRDVMVAGFYSSGTVLIDFGDPANPKLLDQQKQEGTSSWASYHYRGAVFSGDGGRGFDAYVLA